MTGCGLCCTKLTSESINDDWLTENRHPTHTENGKNADGKKMAEWAKNKRIIYCGLLSQSDRDSRPHREVCFPNWGVIACKKSKRLEEIIGRKTVREGSLMCWLNGLEQNGWVENEWCQLYLLQMTEEFPHLMTDDENCVRRRKPESTSLLIAVWWIKKNHVDEKIFLQTGQNRMKWRYTHGSWTTQWRYWAVWMEHGRWGITRTTRVVWFRGEIGIY